MLCLGFTGLHDQPGDVVGFGLGFRNGKKMEVSEGMEKKLKDSL